MGSDWFAGFYGLDRFAGFHGSNRHLVCGQLWVMTGCGDNFFFNMSYGRLVVVTAMGGGWL